MYTYISSRRYAWSHKHMKSYSTSLTEKNANKTTRQCCIPIRMATVSGTWQHQVLMSTQNHQNVLTLPTGMQNHTGTLKTSWAVFCKFKHNHCTTQQSHSRAFPPREMKILCAHKNLYTDVYSSFHPNNLKLKPPPPAPPNPCNVHGLWADKRQCSSALKHSSATNTEDLPPRSFGWIASALCQVTEARLLGLHLCASIHGTLQKWQN